MVSKQIACIALVGLVAACGARASNPVAISQPGDKSLTCEQIAVQVKANNDLAVKKAGGDQATIDQNAAAVAVGTILFWPAMLAVDLSNAEQIELRALHDRNKSLERLYKKKDCAAA